MRAGAFFLCREVPAPGRRVRRPDQSTRPTGRSARGVRCEPRDLAPQNLSILPARFPGPRPRPRVTLDRAKTRGFVHARSMVFSPGQVRQKGCHFRGVDIIERAVDVPRICAGALEQCLNYLVAKDVAVHLDLQEMALMLPAFVGRPDPARKCGPHTGIESKVGRVV